MRRLLQQSADDSNSYVKVQLAFITTGPAAASLQQQLLSSLSGGLISGLQQAGLKASSVVFNSLDVQQVTRRLALIQYLVNRAMHPSHLSNAKCMYCANTTFADVPVAAGIYLAVHWLLRAPQATKLVLLEHHATV